MKLVASAPARRLSLLLPIALILAAVWVVYGQVATHDYVNFDDDIYILHNSHVLGGLTIEGLRWAWSAAHEAYWLPLTWMSFMLDIRLFGANAGAQLLENVALHTVSVALLYALLVSWTGRKWPSAWVAAIFALHPLHVESVAWVSQRKDVLSGVFWMLTLLAYGRWVAHPSRRRFVMLLTSFALGLLAKPMLVTLPLVLLLLDVWPLHRREPLWSLIREKIPLFLLAVAASLVTVVTQGEAGAVVQVGSVGIDARIANAVTGYLRYIGKLVAPVDLAVFYPLAPASPDIAAGAGAILVIATLAAVKVRKSHPYIFTGWLWFVIALLPVIGLVQVGGQAIADRYTYLPSIGLTIALAWAVAHLAESSAAARVVLSAASAVTVAGCALVTYTQVGYWRDSISLFGHAVAVTDGNFLAHNNLGEALMRAGRTEEAGKHYAAAVEIHPGYPEARNNYGTFLGGQGRYGEAEQQFRAALAVRPQFAAAENNLATTLARLGRFDEAAAHYARALEIEPENADAQYGYGDVLMLSGRPWEAVVHYQAALRLRPGWPEAQAGLNRARASTGGA